MRTQMKLHDTSNWQPNPWNKPVLAGQFVVVIPDSFEAVS